MADGLLSLVAGDWGAGVRPRAMPLGVLPRVSISIELLVFLLTKAFWEREREPERESCVCQRSSL